MHWPFWRLACLGHKLSRRLRQAATSGAQARPRSLPEQPDQLLISFLPFMQRKLRRDGLHLFNIRYWDNVLPSIVQLGASVIVRYDPRNLSKVFVLRPDRRYFPIPYADLFLPPITLWEQRAALADLRAHGDNAPAQAAIFRAVTAQRALVERAAAKTKAARRQSQRQKDAQHASVGVPPGTVLGATSSGRHSVDYSQPVEPSDAEVWDH